MSEQLQTENARRTYHLRQVVRATPVVVLRLYCNLSTLIIPVLARALFAVGSLPPD